MEELHPEAAQIIDARADASIPPFRSLSPTGLRNLVRRTRTTSEDPPAIDSIDEYRVSGPNGDVPVRTYDPTRETDTPAVVYFHGGGWVYGDLDYVDPLCRVLADRLQWPVVSVDYRLAPEHPFPTPFQDAYAGASWVAEYAESLGIDPDRVVLAGDSAGGNLATAVALRAREAPDAFRPAYQVLVYPLLEYAFDTESYSTFSEGYYVTRADLRWFWNQYIGSEIDAKNSYACPLAARSLDGLPDATVLTAGCDPLRDEGEAYATRLEDTGADVNLVRFEKMIHGFFTRVPDLDVGMDAIDVVVDDLTAALGS